MSNNSNNLLLSSFRATRSECLKSQYTQYHYSDDNIVKQTTSRPSSAVGQKKLSKQKRLLNNNNNNNNDKLVALHTHAQLSQLDDALHALSIHNIDNNNNENINTNNHDSRPVTASSTVRRYTTVSNHTNIRPSTAISTIGRRKSYVHTLHNTIQQSSCNPFNNDIMNDIDELQSHINLVKQYYPHTRTTLTEDIDRLLIQIKNNVNDLVDKYNYAQPIAENTEQQINYYKQQYNILQQKYDSLQVLQLTDLQQLKHDIQLIEQNIKNEGMQCESVADINSIDNELYKLIQLKQKRSTEYCFVLQQKLAQLRQQQLYTKSYMNSIV